MADITAPVLQSFSRASGTGLHPNQQVTMLYDVYDESPVGNVAFAFHGLTGNTYVAQVYASSSNSLDVGQAVTLVKDHWPDGYYTLQMINITERDGERNHISYERDGGIYKYPSGIVAPNAHNFKLAAGDFIVGDIAAPHTQMAGTDRNDSLSGTKSHDMIAAAAGNDTVIGNQGNDIIDGGAGTDAAKWTSPRRSYDIFINAGDDSIVTGQQESDTIRNVEKFIFTDGEFRTDTEDIAAQIYRIYGATLDRTPDAGGLKYWVSELESGISDIRTTVNNFTASEEFQVKYGSLDDGAFLSLLYNNVLGRDPDAEGFQYWTNSMSNGMSRSEVVLNFSEAAENIEITRPEVERGIWVRDDQAATVARMYDTTLDRLPDASGLNGWVNAMKAGMTPQQLANNFTGSVEFYQKYGRLDDTAFVQQLYRNVLDREGEANGVENWKAALQGGMSRAEVVLGFSEALEHQNKLAAYIDDGVWLL